MKFHSERLRSLNLPSSTTPSPGFRPPSPRWVEGEVGEWPIGILFSASPRGGRLGRRTNRRTCGLLRRFRRETRQATRRGDRPATAKCAIERNQIERDVGLGDGQLVLLCDERGLVRVHPVKVNRAGSVLGHNQLHRSLRGGHALFEPLRLLLGLQEGNECVFGFFSGLQDSLLIRQHVGREPRSSVRTVLRMRP